MAAFVRIEEIKEQHAHNMLVSSLSFIHPMKLVFQDETSIDIVLFDCDSKESLNDRLEHLCEASSVDFTYRYAFK